MDSIREFVEAPSIKNVSVEILRECKRLNIDVNRLIVKYVVYLFSLHPNDGINFAEKPKRLQVEQFVQKCIEKFSDLDNPEIKTMNLQHEFYNMMSLEDVKRKFNETIESRLAGMIKEISEATSKSDDDLDRIFGRLVIYITVLHRIGNPSDGKVMEASSNALRSVMTREDLIDFLGKKKNQRGEYIQSLGKIVCGIRLFNKEDHLCDDGIRNIFEDLITGYDNTKKALSSALSQTNELIVLGTKAVRECMDYNEFTEEFVNLFKSDVISNETLHKFKGFLIMLYQHENYLKTLIQLNTKAYHSIEELKEEYNKVLFQLHDVVQFRIAVPTDLVFPHFQELSNIWEQLCTYLNYFVQVINFNERMRRIVSFKFPFKDTCLKMIKNSIKARPSKKLTLDFVALNKFTPLNETIMTRFCATTFVKTNGFLLPSSSRVGMITKGEFHYGFSSLLLAEPFDRNFEKEKHGFLKTMFLNPGCIGFFDLYKETKGIRFSKEEASEIVQIMHKNSVDVQTDLHPIPVNKDVNYMFSVWDLRRKGLQMANLVKCKTTSSQTLHSFHRRDAKVQTVEMVQNGIQTTKEEGENSHDYFGVNLPLDFRRPQ
ncbi:CFAP206 family protein [Megaselia abdita]